ncbi:MAG TPA: hypothetical protein VHA57_04985 [Actinomycetota bacterium]|nr:hypothetical protein [Actinomycetota bacterium]
MKAARAPLAALLLTVVAFGAGCAKKPAAPANQVPLTPSPTGPSTPATPGPTASPGASSATAAVAGVTPGHGTPAAAYAGYLDAATQGQVATECSYVLPSQQPSCPQTMNENTVTIQGPPITIGTVDIVGNQALLVPVGTVCVDGTCLPNSDPSTGIPTSPAGFTHAYDLATQTETDPTAGLGEVNGQWYLDLGGAEPSNPVV